MSLLSILETLLIGPIELLLEFALEYLNRFTKSPGLSVLFLSLLLSLLFLPVYRRAGALEKRGQALGGIWAVLCRESVVRLLLDALLFAASWRFFSQTAFLEDVSFGAVPDLGAPDGLLSLGGRTVSLLPLAAAAAGAAACALRVKDKPGKERLFAGGETLLFLLLLWRQPSGPVLFWTVGAAVVLGDGLLRSLKEPERVLRFAGAVLGVALLVFSLFFYSTDAVKRKIILAVLGLGLLLLPWSRSLRKRLPCRGKPETGRPSGAQFLLSAAFMTCLTGLFIPSMYIAASPQDFVNINSFYNPLWYIVCSFCLAAGSFLFWTGGAYLLAGPRGRRLLEKLMWPACGLMFADSFFFGTNLGIISSHLQYDREMAFSSSELLVNLLILLILALAFWACAKKWRFAVAPALGVFLFVLCGLSATNLWTIQRSVSELAVRSDEETPAFRLSRTGKNVIVLMLDRALGEYTPYIFREKPELQEQFSGFTWYRNTMSFGGNTNFAAPALFGGYEYTPVELNRRDTEPLVIKHNEALMVMPVLFSENGWEVTVCDLPDANYQLVPDLSIFDGYPEIRTFITNGWFVDEEESRETVRTTSRNFFCFSLMKTLPLFLQPTVYDYGIYHQLDHDANIVTTQKRNGLSIASGLSEKFMSAYRVLENMADMTEITSDDRNTFLVLDNNTAHEPAMLSEPDYTPSFWVDNTAYDAENTERFTLDGRELKMNDNVQVTHYHSNMAAMLQLGRWFDTLREEGVYDNTRIILVSDHGYDLAHLDYFMMDDGAGEIVDTEFYYPLLMVKDFNSEGFTVSDEFMTNGDVPTLAAQGVIAAPVNPFTGKPIDNREKTAHDQVIIRSDEWHIQINNGETFLPSKWASVKDNIWDRSNWTFYNEETVLKEHAFP